jgi:ABC-2 type transport system permease protein
MQSLAAMIVKEGWALLRDPKARIILVLPPLLQLLIFTYATTLDVKNVDIGILNRSTGV